MEYLNKFPNGKFYVLIFPDQTNKIQPHLKDLNIEIINLSDANLAPINGIQEDGFHPNEIGANKVSELIIDRIWN